jgi:hypothetical protein
VQAATSPVQRENTETRAIDMHAQLFPEELYVPVCPCVGNPLSGVQRPAVIQYNRQEGQATSRVLDSPTAVQEEEGRAPLSSEREGARRRINRMGEYVAVQRIPPGLRIPVPNSIVEVPVPSVVRAPPLVISEIAPCTDNTDPPMNRSEMMEWMRGQQETAKEGSERIMAIVERLAPGTVVPPVHLLMDPVRVPTPYVPVGSNGVGQSFLGSDMRDVDIPNKLRPRGLGLELFNTTRGAPGGLIPLIPFHAAGLAN